MKGLLQRLFFFIVIAIVPLSASQTILTNDDIPRVMDRLFSLHIENRSLNPTIIRRVFKVYIEQFDPDKSYLLLNEVLPYLQMSDAQVNAVLQRMQKQNYSDVRALNDLIQKAILRSQNNRNNWTSQFPDISAESSSKVQSSFASNEVELLQRQKIRMKRFYLYHEEKSDLSTLARKQKLLSLYDKKVRRTENLYLFEKMDSKTANHQFIVHFLKAFAKSLDTHSTFFSPQEAHDMRLSLEKQFDGVGVILFEGVDGVLISDVVKGSPAEECGQIRVNDLLMEIDGTTLEAVSFEDVLGLLKKENQNEVVLGFKRGSSFFRIPLTKRPIVMNDSRITTSYESFQDGVIGKISLYSFYESSDGMSSEKDIKDAIRSFQKIGPVYGLILDLRDNSGGFLSQAIKVAGLFLSNGVVAISKYGKGEIHYLRNLAGHRFYNGPLVILTSKMSASASEIVAQALQDYGVALVVGDERTFGKGSIQYQTVTDLNADLFYKVTVGKYYTASGRTTQIEGVKADIVVPTQYAPYRIGERYLEYPLQPDHVSPAFVDPLTDLDAKTRWLFEAKYMPNLQRVVSFWHKVLPLLCQKSAARLLQNADFQKILRDQEKMQSRLESLPPNSIDEVTSQSKDFSMEEAVNIVRDMIQMQEQSTPMSFLELLPTGSD